MVGNEFYEQGYYEPCPPGRAHPELKGLCGPGFHNIDLRIRKGEVVGFTGLKGAGISEMMQALFGALPITHGELRVDGKLFHGDDIHQAMKNKIAMIAANRKENSVIPDFTLLDNMCISEFTLSYGRQVISGKRENRKYLDKKGLLDIKANDSSDMITSLSGGNQQKVILARWLNINADILLMDNPTQGIDGGQGRDLQADSRSG